MRPTYNHWLGTRRSPRLEEQIRTDDHNKELKKKTSETIPATIGALTDTINAERREANDALYPDQRRKCSIFAYEAATDGVSYAFDYHGDKGSGAKSKNLVLFDLAVLRSTPLPFLIKDSAIIKTIAFASVTELLEVYCNTASPDSGANEPKHVCFSYAATKLYGMKADRSSPTHESIILTMVLKHVMASPGIPSQMTRQPKE